jgi:8-oxo-dGTP diphosphatase
MIQCLTKFMKNLNMHMNKKEIEVVAAVIKREDKYYVVQRPFRGEVGGKWEFPGGKIEQGESHHDALIREINEELNVAIEIDKFLLTNYHEYESFKIVLHFYLCLLQDGTPMLNEHIDELWLNKTELKQLDFAAADVPVLDII